MKNNSQYKTALCNVMITSGTETLFIVSPTGNSVIIRFLGNKWNLMSYELIKFIDQTIRHKRNSYKKYKMTYRLMQEIKYLSELK